MSGVHSSIAGVTDGQRKRIYRQVVVTRHSLVVVGEIGLEGEVGHSRREYHQTIEHVFVGGLLLGAKNGRRWTVLELHLKEIFHGILGREIDGLGSREGQEYLVAVAHHVTTKLKIVVSFAWLGWLRLICVRRS